MNILFLASEVSSLIKTGGLADVAKALPSHLMLNKQKIILCIPCYSLIENSKNFPIIGKGVLNANSPISTEYNIRQTFLPSGVEVWLIECDKYFDRTSLYGDNNQAYIDNGQRFAFYSAASLDACKVLDFKVDIVHCNDWHTALCPMILRIKYSQDPFFEKTRSVLSIHNGAFQGVFDRDQLSIVPEIANIHNDMINQGSYINFLKCGVFYADKINTVSPGYASELTTYLGGHGMTKNFQDRSEDLVGILNGCDYSDWDPSTDQHLNIRFDESTLDEKVLGKYLLQRKVDLPMGDDPLYGMVARITDQKGIGILIPVLEKFLQHRVQIIIQGTGDPTFEQELKNLSQKYPHKFVYFPVYNNNLAHQIEACSDFFLMPSIFEPCGLNQMYSLAYATLPIVRSVGGLKDTVIDYDTDRENANGFVFFEPNSQELLSTLRRTLIFYLEDQDEMERIKRNAIGVKFLWEDAVKEYIKLYHKALEKPKWW